MSRTAENLFWLGRYTERAANVARGLQVAHRLHSLSRTFGGAEDEWRGLLVASGCDAGFYAQHDNASPEAVTHYLVRDPSNLSGIVPCFEAARQNGRAVRTALTVEMWEALNDTWIELRRLPPDVLEADRLTTFLDWVKSRTLLFNGAAIDTMLRDDAWRFVHLGTMLERADNTARLLDVRHQWLQPRNGTGGAVEYAHWQAVLRSVSALRAYQWVYHSRLQPRLIAELMILRPELPRSLRACFARVEQTLEAIANNHGGTRLECHRLAGELHAQLRYGRIDAIMEQGVHEYLTLLIDRTIELGTQIGAGYLSG
nr:alpha-E domain-containing protein [Roseomonas acroporae]